jgi:hypothetical protein
MNWITETTPKPRARITGLAYLLYFLTAILAQFLDGRGLVIYAHAINVVAIVSYTAVTLLSYSMFKPVNRILSLLAALFSLAGCVVMAFGFLHLAWLPISPLVFFGPYCLMIGYLIYRSAFLPRLMGALMALAGLGWLIFLLPNLPHSVSVCIEAFGILAEGSLMLWLVVMGVNLQQWRRQSAQQDRRRLSMQRFLMHRFREPVGPVPAQFDPFGSKEE